MKKLLTLVGVLGLSATLIGCEAQTMTTNNLEYLEQISTEKSNTVVFKDKNGDITGFNSESVLKLVKGEKYDVEYTISDLFNYGDYIEHIQESRE
ncbi:hypothetical protein ACU3L3_07280 [Priestia endophytica]